MHDSGGVNVVVKGRCVFCVSLAVNVVVVMMEAALASIVLATLTKNSARSK